MPLDRLRDECRKKGIHRLVITDHNSIDGAVLAYQLDPQLFIIGEEIMTSQGELLAAPLKERVPPGLSPGETIEILKSQGAFIAVAHPFDMMRSGHWEMDNLLKILEDIDAIEVFNSRCIAREANQQAHDFVQQHDLAVIVGSDSHTLGEVGASTLQLPYFTDPDSLRLALKSAILKTRLSSPWVHFQSSYARWRKKTRPTQLN